MQTDYLTHLSLGLVQHKSLAPVLSFFDLADVELHLGTVFVLHGLPLVQSHLLGTFVLYFLSLILPSTQTHSTEVICMIMDASCPAPYDVKLSLPRLSEMRQV